MGLYSLHETSWKTDMLICLHTSCSAWSLKEWSPTTTLPIIAQLTPHPSHLHSQCTTCCMGIQHLNIKLYIPFQPLIITYYEKWVQKVTISFETTTIINTHPFPSSCCSSFLIVTPTFNNSSTSNSQQHSKYYNMDSTMLFYTCPPPKANLRLKAIIVVLYNTWDKYEAESIAHRYQVHSRWFMSWTKHLSPKEITFNVTTSNQTLALYNHLNLYPRSWLTPLCPW